MPSAPYLLFLPSLGPMEIIVLLIIVLILFGPGKLPKVFSALGDGVRQFKKASKDISDELTTMPNGETVPPTGPHEKVE